MKLLFITQKLHGQDAFTVLWVEAFEKLGYTVQVVCLEWRPEEIEKVLHRVPTFSVHSLGKEGGNARWSQIFRFWKLASTLEYDRVFIHMTPVWYALGWKIFLLRRKPVYLWYTHYKQQLGVRLFKLFGKRAFCATPQSLPMLEGNPKKVVTGHGIDMSLWPKRENVSTDSNRLLMVHRLSRSKRVELSIRALTLLPQQYTLEIYGIEAEKDYVAELKQLVIDLNLTERIEWKGTIEMTKLPSVFTNHRFVLNMASETIDKTMLEAMTCGCYPVTTARNAEAIGLVAAPAEDTPQAIAAFIQDHQASPMPAQDMFDIVREHHSLHALVELMDTYIRPGV